MRLSVKAWERRLYRLLRDYGSSRRSRAPMELQLLQYRASVLAADARQVAAPDGARARLHHLLASLAEATRRRGDQLVHLQLAKQFAGDDAAFAALIQAELDMWYRVPRVFVSYARLDVGRVRPVVEFLRQEGADVHWDEDFAHGDIGASIAQHMDWVVFQSPLGPEIPPQAAVGRMVDSAISSCGIYLVAWSSTYRSRSWTRYELERALASCDARALQSGPSVRMVVVRLDDEPLPPEVVTDLHVDLRGGPDISTRQLRQRIFAG